MSVDGLAAGGDSGIADATIFLKRAFRLRRLGLGSDARFFLQRALDHSLLWHGSCSFGRIVKEGRCKVGELRITWKQETPAGMGVPAGVEFSC